MRVRFREIDLSALAARQARQDGGFVKKLAGLWFVMFAIFCYGLLLPTDWVTSPLFGPIRWAALYVPVVGNYAEASPIPDFVRAFLGLVVYLPPFFGLYFFCKLNIERTMPGLITVLVSPFEERDPAYSDMPTFTAFMNRHPLFRAAFGFLVFGGIALVFYIGESAEELERHCAQGGEGSFDSCLILFLLQDRFWLSLWGTLFTPFMGLLMYFWFHFAVQFWVELTGADLAPTASAGQFGVAFQQEIRQKIQQVKSDRSGVSAVILSSALFHPVGAAPVQNEPRTLARCIDTARQANIAQQHIVVALGPEEEELAAEARRHGVKTVKRAGLDSALSAACDVLADRAGIILLPTRMADVGADTLSRLLNALGGEIEVVHPLFRGERGLPLALSGELLDSAAGYSSKKPEHPLFWLRLAAYERRHPESVREETLWDPCIVQK